MGELDDWDKEDNWESIAMDQFRAGKPVTEIAAFLERPVETIEESIRDYFHRKAVGLSEMNDSLLEIDRIDQMIASLWTGVQAGDTKATAQVQRMMQRRASLVGQMRRRPAKQVDDIEVRAPADASWYRQDGETSKAYTAFSFYRDQGPARTVTAAWRRYADYHNTDAKVHPSSWKGWKKKNRWEERCKDFDNLVAELAVTRSLNVIEGARREYLDAAPDAAHAMVQMMNGHGADHARIAAARDILDRIGFVRQRSGVKGATPSAFNSRPENLTFNLNAENMTLEDLIQVSRILAEDPDQ